MYKSEQDFFGVYRDVLLGYVQYKRSLGFDVGWRSIYTLLELNRFLDSCQPDRIVLTKQMVEAFIHRKDNPSTKYIHISECVMRQFGLYLRNQRYQNIYIHPENHVRVTSDFIPYIFTAEQVCKMLEVTDQLKPLPHNPHYPIFFQALLRLLYCTGLRINEALGLKVNDVDFSNNLLIVLNGKENVSRLVPFSNDLRTCLLKYQSVAATEQDTYFFESPRKGMRSSHAVNCFFQRVILPSAGINRKPDNTGPRIHDLRHTFACHALDKMVRDGKDPYCALPYLSAYLGHKGIESTEKYLRLTADHFSGIIDAGHYIYEEGVGDYDD